MVSPTPFRMAEFKSSYGPKYQFQPHVGGWSSPMLMRLGVKSALYGGAAGAAVLLYVSGIPRVQRDILQKIPVIGPYFVKEVVPSDNNPVLNRKRTGSSRDERQFSPDPNEFARLMMGALEIDHDDSTRHSSLASLLSVACGIPVIVLIHAMAFKAVKLQLSWLNLLLPGAVVLGSLGWVHLVSTVVPEPYLDEVFHIPQAQKYCLGKFAEWDDKITTPPGLYLLSVLAPISLAKLGVTQTAICDAQSLRMVNVVGLMMLGYLALLCRHKIEAQLGGSSSIREKNSISQYSLHTAANICVFPLLFFFSGLYYTDVVSTATVLAVFVNHLARAGRAQNSASSDLLTVLLGLLSLLLRQTNVFWVVIFAGGLEAIQAVKTLRPKTANEQPPSNMLGHLTYYAQLYSVGHVHDPALDQAWPDDWLISATSLIIAALCNLHTVLRRIWPYIAVLLSFVGFVAWNGGVVLGDKSNHVATIHFAQMLYIWPLFGFFSLPLMLPYAVYLIDAVVPWAAISSPDSSSGPAAPHGGKDNAPPSSAPSAKVDDIAIQGSQSKLVQFATRAVELRLPWVLYIPLTLLTSAAVVKYNTIIHPFTLADNRHYMFYVFRYTIRRGSRIKFVLILPYTLSRWLVWNVLSGSPKPSAIYTASQASATEYHCHPFRPSTESSQSAPKTSSISEKQGSLRQSPRRVGESQQQDALAVSTNVAPTSTVLVFLLTTALSLITAPLVEPRYFIIPWVMWRLYVPAWRPQPSGDNGRGIIAAAERSNMLQRVVRFCRLYDGRLVLETLWFVAINAATCYVFLAWPYQWRAEDGEVLDGGRLQRFMW